LKTVAGVLAALTMLGLAGASHAQAWVAAPGQGQAILKFESLRADEGYDPDGDRLALPTSRRDDAVSLFVEYGVADRVAVLFKGDWQRGSDAFVDYDGRGPLELGVRWQAWRDDRGAASLQVSYADGGEGRNAGYAAPGQGDSDWEVRAAVGRNFTARGSPVFVDLQAARRMRQGLPDETRGEATVGVRTGGGWMVLAQVFGGLTDDDGARWLNAETSLVREWEEWSLQFGWRSAVAGRETPAASGPVVALWRRF
jgi:protein XagA